MDTKKHLEELMETRKVCDIKFRDVQGDEIEIRGHIVKMEEVSGREIIETDAGFTIGMDQLITIDGRSVEN